LPEDKFKTQLEELMIQDETGSWWMIGYETEQWYRHDGNTWIPASLQSAPLGQSVSMSSWVAVLWIVLAWTISWAVGTAIFETFFRDVNLLAFAGAISGALGGFITAMILRNENAISNWNDVLWITLAWMLSSAIGWTSAMAITLGLAGLVLAVILKVKKKLPDWNAVIVVALAWITGSSIGSGILLPISGVTGRIVSDALGGAIAAAIGGFVTIWQLRKR
jgi:hypothetical protein